MIRRSDWPLLGLHPRQTPTADPPVPTSGAAQPLRCEGEMYPSWAAQPRRALTLGLLCSLHWGPARKLLSAYRAAYPDVDLEIRDLDDASLREAFSTGRIDAAIVPDAGLSGSWRRTPLWRERLIAVLPEGHILATANAVTPEALRNEVVLLAGDGGGGGRALQNAIIQVLGGPPAAFVRHPVERDTLFDLVALGLGITVSPGSCLGAFYPGVSLRPIISPGAALDYALIWPKVTGNTAVDDLAQLAGLVGQMAGEHA